MVYSAKNIPTGTYSAKIDQEWELRGWVDDQRQKKRQKEAYMGQMKGAQHDLWSKAVPDSGTDMSDFLADPAAKSAFWFRNRSRSAFNYMTHFSPLCIGIDKQVVIPW